MSDSPEANKALMRRYYVEIWQEGKLDAARELVSPEFVDHMPGPEQSPGWAGHEETVRIVRTAFPDLELTIDDLLGEDDRVVGRWTMRATHNGDLAGIPPSGKPVVFSGIDITRWENGQLAEMWHIEDIMGMMIQIGALPGFA